MKKWLPRLLLALAVGILLPVLPALLTQGVGNGADLSGRVGLAGGVSAATFAVLFLGGFLTSLTPCVYPLIPITVGIFGARQAEKRARSVALSATYVGGIAAMYSGLGLFAALSELLGDKSIPSAAGTAFFGESAPWLGLYFRVRRIP